MSLHRQSKGPHIKKHPDEVRIGACADYLLGMSMKDIERKYGLPDSTIVTFWIKKSGSFKIRKPHAKPLNLPAVVKPPKVLRKTKETAVDPGPDLFDNNG